MNSLKRAKFLPHGSGVFTPEMETCYWPMASRAGSTRVVQIKNLWSKHSRLSPLLLPKFKLATEIEGLHFLSSSCLDLPLLLQLLPLWTFYLQSCPTQSYLHPPLHHSTCLKSKSDHATKHTICSWLLTQLIWISGSTEWRQAQWPCPVKEI